MKITTRQLAIMLSLVIISSKLLTFPALMSTYAQKDIYLSVAIGLLIDFIFIMIFMSIMQKNQNLTFNQLLNNTIGKFFTKIIYLILFVFFILKTLLVFKQTHTFVLELLFEELPWLFYVVPMLVVIYFILSKNFRTQARSSEMIFPIIIIGVIITLLLPVNIPKIYNALPMFENGISPMIKGWYNCLFCFGDYFILFVVMGTIKFENKKDLKVFIYVSISSLFIIVFYFLFVTIFGVLGVNKALSFSDFPLNSNMPGNNGRLDWLSSIIWTFSLTIQIFLFSLSSKQCLHKLTNINNKTLLSCIVIFILFLGTIFFYLSLSEFIHFITNKYFLISFGIVYFALPILVIMCYLIYSKKAKHKN